MIRPDPVFGFDVYDVAGTHLSAGALDILGRVQRTLDADIAPLLADAWESATMPDAVLESLIPLNLMAPDGVEPAEAASSIFAGLRNYVLARTDVSVATLYNAQSGLFRTTVLRGGSAEQAAELDPLIRSFQMRGAFALTEPDHGSDIAGGMATRARRDGTDWIIDGVKRWIGGAATAGVLAVFARDESDGEVKAFLVPREATGVSLEPITHKIALRPMQNATIVLDNVRVPAEARLARVNSWRDVAGILGAMRSDVAWIAAGLQAGALDSAVRYATEREQFGRPIAGFQLVQEKIARMLGSLTASLGMLVQLAARQDAGEYSDPASALAKMWVAAQARTTAALAREIVGGNGILLDHGVARFFADAEAVYSYEGTHEITSLVVGRALTGEQAFA